MTRTVSDIMATRLITFSQETSINEAIHVLLEKRLSGAPVVDDANNLIGVLSKKDCLRIVLNMTYHQHWGGTVGEYMSTNVATIDSETDLMDAVELFLNSNFRRFPVLSDGRLVGQISRHDVLRSLIDGA